jgi:hypothetical protein
MRCHDLRIALAAIVAFGPVAFAGVYGIANAGKSQAANAAVAAPAPVGSTAFLPAPEGPPMTVLPQGKDRHVHGVPGASIASGTAVPAGLDPPRAPRPRKHATRQTHESHS